MPTYVYEREDGTQFELSQKITEDALEVCPETGQKVKRIISGGNFILKGGGWYKDGYGSSGGSGSSSSSSTSSDSSSSSNSTGSSSSSSSTKSETKASDSSPSGSCAGSPDKCGCSH